MLHPACQPLQTVKHGPPRLSESFLFGSIQAERDCNLSVWRPLSFAISYSCHLLASKTHAVATIGTTEITCRLRGYCDRSRASCNRALSRRIEPFFLVSFRPFERLVGRFAFVLNAQIAPRLRTFHTTRPPLLGPFFASGFLISIPLVAVVIVSAARRTGAPVRTKRVDEPLYPLDGLVVPGIPPGWHPSAPRPPPFCILIMHRNGRRHRRRWARRELPRSVRHQGGGCHIGVGHPGRRERREFLRGRRSLRQTGRRQKRGQDDLPP